MSNEETIFTGSPDTPLRVTIEFEENFTLEMAQALFSQIENRNYKITGGEIVEFDVLYAGELVSVLITLSLVCQMNWGMTFRWTNGRSGLYIMVAII